MGGVAYTAEQLAWIKDNYTSYPTGQQLTDAFNAMFGCNRKMCAIRQAATRLCGLKRNERNLYTPEEDAWLTENYPLYNSDVLSKMFVEKFGHKTSARGLISHCNSILNITSGRQFYEKGCVPTNALPVGSERKTSKGYIMVKLNDIKSCRGDSETYHKNWEFKHILVWEEHHGKIPQNHTIVFLDGNNSNCDINNLRCVPKKIAVVMARNKWFTGDAELTDTAIKWCELHYAIKEAVTVGE